MKVAYAYTQAGDGWEVYDGLTRLGWWPDWDSMYATLGARGYVVRKAGR